MYVAASGYVMDTLCVHAMTNRDQEGLKSLRSSAQCRNLRILSMSIYDLVLIYVCHFHHQDHPVIFLSNHGLSRYSSLHLGSLHPRILLIESYSFLNSLMLLEYKHIWVEAECLLIGVYVPSDQKNAPLHMLDT